MEKLNPVGRLDMLKYLVENSTKFKLNVEATDYDGKNVLFYCVDSGDLRVLQFVLNIGIKPRVDSCARTLLMQAARTGNQPSTVYLLDHASSLCLDPLAVDCRGETALFYGARSSSGPVVAALIDVGRLRLTSNCAGEDVVDVALDAGSNDVVRTLLDRFPSALSRRDARGRTVLHRFVERGQLNMLKRYSQSNNKTGCDADSSGLTLLMAACSQSTVDHRKTADIVKFLVESLASDIDAVDQQGRTALHHAVKSGQLDSAAYLLSRPGNRAARITDTQGTSLLVVAIGTGRPEMISLLLESNIGRELVTSVDADGRGPIHHWVALSADDDDSAAARTRRTAILFDLVAHRCDVNLADSRGLTPLMLAARSGRSGAISALIQLRDAMPSTAYPLTTNRVDAEGRTALHHGCSASTPSLRCCKTLVRAGIDVNKADKEGVTALMLACQSYVPGMNVSVIRYLVEHGGADPVRQDSEGRDSFDYCPPIEADYLRAVLREGAEMANPERAALKDFVDRVLCLQQTDTGSCHYSLHIASVLRGLVREGIFTKTLSFEVMKQTPGERLRKLVDLLCTRGERAFPAFCRVLKEEADQPELAYMMMKAAYRRQREIFC